LRVWTLILVIMVALVAVVICAKCFGASAAFSIGAAAIITLLTVVGPLPDGADPPPSREPAIAHVTEAFNEAMAREVAAGMLHATKRDLSGECDGAACWRMPIHV